jgi:ABC-type dipeptide/oligopeptide/nickel transport system permease subunit
MRRGIITSVPSVFYFLLLLFCFEGDDKLAIIVLCISSQPSVFNQESCQTLILKSILP